MAFQRSRAYSKTKAEKAMLKAHPAREGDRMIHPAGSRIGLRVWAGVSVLLLAVLLLGGCGERGPSSQEGASAQKALPKADGVIGPDEYEHHYRVDQVNMDIYWTVHGDRIYFGLHSAARGWLAIGFDPDGPAMQGADIVFGRVEGENVFIHDEYAPTLSSHVHDTELGGRDDLLARAGREDDQGTTIEWVRRLLTGDTKDRSITAGKHLIMVAFSDSDDPSDYHGQAGLRRALVFLDLLHPEL